MFPDSPDEATGVAFVVSVGFFLFQRTEISPGRVLRAHYLVYPYRIQRSWSSSQKSKVLLNSLLVRSTETAEVILE